MRGLDKRLAELERKLAPARKILVYQESLEDDERGMFRRGAGWRGLAEKDLPPLLTLDEVRADAAAAGATDTILVCYEDRDVTPQPGFMANLDNRSNEQ